jgi:hypothetical protein
MYVNYRLIFHTLSAKIESYIAKQIFLNDDPDDCNGMGKTFKQKNCTKV